MSNTHLSPRQHTECLALLASDADSGESAEFLGSATGDGTKRRQRFTVDYCCLAGLQCRLQPEQLELMIRLLKKVQLSLLRFRTFAVVAMRLNSTHLLTGCFPWYVGVRECRHTAKKAVEVHV